MSSKKRSGSPRKVHGGRVTPKGTRPPEVTRRSSTGGSGDHAAPAPHPGFDPDQHVHGSQAVNGNARRAGRRGNR